MAIQHRYRFGKNGQFLKWFLGRKIKKEPRVFPENIARDTWSYVQDYYHMNRKHGIIAFVGCP